MTREIVLLFVFPVERRVHALEPFTEPGFFRGEFRIAGEIRELVGIGRVIVELLEAVEIADVAPTAVAHGMTALLALRLRGDCRHGPRCARIAELRHEAR